MNSLDNIPAAFNRFTAVARRFCNIVDSSADLDRASLLVHIYGVLPELIQEAINLPAVGSGDDEVSEEIKLDWASQSGAVSPHFNKHQLLLRI